MDESVTSKYIIASNPLGKYCVPASLAHRPAAKHVLHGHIWEAATLRFMMDHPHGGDIVHAGTFFGDFLPGLSRSLSSGRIVWAFEPNPESHFAARRTIKLNELENVSLTNAGLAEHSASKHLIIERDGKRLGGGSRFATKPRTTDESVEAALVRVDNIVPIGRPVGIVQLDVEGYEAQALAGAMNTIRKWKPDLILESVPHSWLMENLDPLGYASLGQVDNNSVFSASSKRGLRL